MSLSVKSSCRRRRLNAGESLEPRVLLAFNPTPMEQAMLEHTNRMRLDPQGELDILFDSLVPLVASDADVQRAVSFFGVSSPALQSQWSELTPAPPLAWNSALHDAALDHNELMIEFDLQRHVLPGEDDIGTRFVDAGYNFTRAAENVFAFAESELYGHAGFVIDWGDTPNGIQNPPGHRDTIMDANLAEVGIAVSTESDSATDVGPLLITQDFGSRRDYRPQFLGVVWEDGFANGYYDAGEGFGGFEITVKGEQNTYSTTTMLAGGYQLEVEPGTYEIIATDSFLGTYAWGNIEFGNRNVKVDFEIGSANRPPVARDDHFSAASGQARDLNILSNDSDVDGSIDPTTVVITQPPQYGSLSIDAVTGFVTFTAEMNNPGSDTFRYLVRDEDGASSEASVSLEIEPPTVDFNDDGLLNCGDIDALVADIVAGNHTTRFDIASDGVVNHTDLDLWLETAGAANLPGGVAYSPGDANLDGIVDGMDFTIWNDNRYANVAAWCSGDWSADGAVDGTDFNIWNEHKFVAAAGSLGKDDASGSDSSGIPRNVDPRPPRGPLPSLDKVSTMRPLRFHSRLHATGARETLPSRTGKPSGSFRVAPHVVARYSHASLRGDASRAMLPARAVDEFFAGFTLEIDLGRVFQQHQGFER